jgi:hypothetical protein
LRELPSLDGDARIEQELFCWRLYTGKQYIECRSEEEATYLMVFLRSGRREVYIPRNDAYLKEILPQLLYLKKRHDEIIEDRVDGLVGQKLRQRARSKVWSDIFLVVEDAELQ